MLVELSLLDLIILQVSIYGHSLGSVLSYDILCHQECFEATSSGFVYTGNAGKIGCDPEVASDTIQTFEDTEVSANRNVCGEIHTSNFLSSDSSLSSDVSIEVSEEFQQSSCQRSQEILKSCVEDRKNIDTHSDQSADAKEIKEEVPLVFKPYPLTLSLK